MEPPFLTAAPSKGTGDVEDGLAEETLVLNPDDPLAPPVELAPLGLLPLAEPEPDPDPEPEPEPEPEPDPLPLVPLEPEPPLPPLIGLEPEPDSPPGEPLLPLEPEPLLPLEPEPLPTLPLGVATAAAPEDPGVTVMTV